MNFASDVSAMLSNSSNRIEKVVRGKRTGGGREKRLSAWQLCCYPPRAEPWGRTGSMPMQMKSYKANAAP